MAFGGWADKENEKDKETEERDCAQKRRGVCRAFGKNYLAGTGFFCGSSNFTLGAGASGVSVAEVTGLALAAGCTGETSGAGDIGAGATAAGAAGTGAAAAGFVAGDFDGGEVGASVAGFAVAVGAGGTAAKPRSVSSMQ